MLTGVGHRGAGLGCMDAPDRAVGGGLSLVAEVSPHGRALAWLSEALLSVFAGALVLFQEDIFLNLSLLFPSMSFCGTANVAENEVQSVLPCEA